MLTDVFFRRYENRPLFEAFGQKEAALFVQAYRLINEQIWKYYGFDGKTVDEKVKAIWTSLHDHISMEIGVKELSPKWYSYQTDWNGKPYTNSGWNTMNCVVERWLHLDFDQTKMDPDAFIKRRLSFVELAFREREGQIAVINAAMPMTLAYASHADAQRRARTQSKYTTSVDAAKKENAATNAQFVSHVHELNERFKQAGMPLHYHNGYIQITAYFGRA